MPRPLTVRQKLMIDIPRGSSCLGCKFLADIPGGTLGFCKLEAENVTKKICGINEGVKG